MARVVLIASAVSAEHGSEPQVGWRWLEAFATATPITLIVDPFWRPHFEEALRQAPFKSNVEVQFVEMPMAQRYNPNRWIFLRHHWWLFRVRRRLRALGFDRGPVAYVTLSTWYFFPVALLGVSALWWGPVGGAFDVPRSVLKELPWKWRSKERLRALAADLLAAVFVRIKNRFSARWFVIARTGDARDELERRLHLSVKAVIPEPITLSADIPPGIRKPVEDGLAVDHRALRFAFVGDPGRPAKNFPLALRLFRLALKEHPECTLHVFGRKYSHREKGVNFRGVLSRDEFLAELAQCDVLLFVSYREGYASTVREALALGLTVVLLPVGGNVAFIEHPKVEALDPHRVGDEAYLSTALALIRKKWAQPAAGFPILDYSAQAQASIAAWLKSCFSP